jgi:hypothetical protein
MNTDSFFDDDFFREHKGLITTIATVSLAFFTIFWLYKNLKSNTQLTEEATLNAEAKTKVAKKRLTINAQDLLYTDLKNFEVSFIYPILETLSQQYDLYLIILVCENQDTNSVLEKFTVLIDDGIILKHVLFKLNLANTFQFKIRGSLCHDKIHQSSCPY